MSCSACGNCKGLGLVFHQSRETAAIAHCVLDDHFQGYAGFAQGGIVATILDSAMTNCLFLMGVRGMSARLRIRFSRPVKVGVPIEVEAEAITRRGRVHELSARITQDGSLRASATGRFVAERLDHGRQE